ncbi:hypothetical protein JIQ42_07490 [Leishmania sp. Namibia]|uniref:hypothetical protein n=1 Tax=Leishmania sp. Namibia TaxID=2802991 RepID=UPI001B490452|nr:hypothetical protein JIQ42_07490 [Leishmania sp. Namibia]
MSGQIFLYISNGRTLWVPRHTASPTETKPVCMLNYVTPMELSRSFYLFDYAVQVVENAQMAAMNPNAKTPNEVLAAVNDFRRVCAEDQNFLLQRCYNSPAQQQQQQPQQQQQQQQQQPQVNAYPSPYSSNNPQQQLMMSSATTSGYSGGNSNTGAAGGMDSAALLTQLLQQQRQQSRVIGGNTNSQGYQDSNTGGTYGYNSNEGRGYYGSDRGRGDRRMHGHAYGSNMGYPQNMMMMQGGMPQQHQPMMMGYNNMSPYGMDQMMMYGGGPGPMYPNARGGSGRRNNSYGDPMMMMQQHPGMYGNRRGMGNNSQSQQSRMGATVRNEPEPINLDGVTVPEEIKTVYMNPAQQLVIATMPGPHMTVWLREHPFPTDLQDKKFVFGKKGICLMLKASFEEVKGSKPVELFPKQICTHFFIYGYCSRPNCFHEHHNEDQLRELIAVRHVQLKAMTKTQRHQLIDEIEQKEKEGLAAAAAHREEREKKRAEAAAEREARRQQRQQQQAQQGPMHTSSSAPNTQPNPSQDIGSDNEDEDGTTMGGAGSSQQQPSANPSLTDMMANSPSQGHQAVSAGAGEAAAKSDAAIKIGITDSDDDDGSSSSGSGSSSVSNAKAKADTDAAEGSEADEDEGDADEDHDGAEEEEQQQEEEEEDAKAKKSKAKKPTPKKRGRVAAPKKATKRAKKQ